MKPRNRRHSAVDADDGADDDSQPLIVPRNDKELAPIAPDRIRRLRRHLVESLRALDPVQDLGPTAPPQPPELEGFTARVAGAACAMCQGWCCKDGGEHAYLDERILARVIQSTPGLGARAILRLYIDRIPTAGYQNSCIFHGRQGCTLNRSLRSDICNGYFCGGLGAFVTRGDTTKPVTVMAGEGARMRTSPVLKP